MEKSFEKYKGIHPGKVLSRILEPTGIKKAEFARNVGTYPQTLNEILKGKRKFPIELSLRIDTALGYPEGTFAELQTYFEIKKAKKKMSEYHPDFDQIRSVVFWDTEIESIDFKTQMKGVIDRILERGNEQEKEVIYNFYGEEIIKNYFIQYVNIFDSIKKSKYFNQFEKLKCKNSIDFNEFQISKLNDIPKSRFDWKNFIIQLKEDEKYCSQNFTKKSKCCYSAIKDHRSMEENADEGILLNKKRDIKDTCDFNELHGENLKYLFTHWVKNFTYKDDKIESDAL